MPLENVAGKSGLASENLSASLLEIALLLAVAGVLGVCISLLYRLSRRGTEIEPRLPSTLVLLSMLITMVTVAVGENVAVAFTLVGTLAIVRFRTAVSDIRDTVFVIFAVAAGISVGNDSMFVGFVGVAVVGIAVVLLRLLGGPQGDDPRANATLRLAVSPPSADEEIYAVALRAQNVRYRIESSRADRERLRLTISCSNVPLDGQARLLTTLLERPEIASADLDFQ